MPLYDYQCRSCLHPFEALVRSGTPPACPRCASLDLEKQLSLPAPQGKSAGLIAQARSQAAREGHFSHYSPAERPKTA